MYGVSKLDEFYRAPLRWPAGERTDDIENTFLKVAVLSHDRLTPQTSFPFDAIESRFLIGLVFRFTLRDIIFSSQQRNNQGILHQPIRDFRRDPVYQEILQYSYQDYFDKFAVPYYQARGLDASAAEAIRRPAICTPMTPVSTPAPASVSSSIKMIFCWPARDWPGPRHVCPGRPDRLPAGRTPRKSVQPGCATDHFGRTGWPETPQIRMSLPNSIRLVGFHPMSPAHTTR